MAVRYYLAAVMEDISETWHRECAGHTTYAQIVSVLSAWAEQVGQRIAFVTFNYDTLLEKALTDNYLGRFALVDDWVTAPMPVLKPHGSCNWVRKLSPAWRDGRQVSTPSEVRDKAIELPPNASELTDEFSTNVRPVGPDLDGGVFTAIPAIAIPVQYKSSSAWEMPERHQDVFKNVLKEADGAVVFGWRAAEVHILRALSANARPDIPIHVVCGPSKDSSPTLTNLVSAGFANFVDHESYLAHFLHHDGLQQIVDGLPVGDSG